MVTGALLGVPSRSERVAAAIDAALTYLASFQRPDGSIHDGQVANYVTSAAVMALARARRPGDAAVVARAREYLRTLQADESEGYSPGDLFYGGVGYGSSERPDLSNTQMALEALAASGVETGDETFRKALAFLQRCQNRSESSDLTLVRDGVSYVPGNDGGGTYAPADSKAGFVALSDGRKVARSYGSMTYALLKGFLLAGLPREDPRVEAAWRWLREHWTLDVNPGFEAQSDPTAAYQGLFYYYLTMAKALDLYGAEQVRDAAGDAHAWRQELCGRLVALQRQDGSWQNANTPRWFEGNPVLATSYALLTLDTACPPGAAAKD
jgi:squalene-hopene/tetraprenyl-beta-curcumene cyclase